MAAKLNTDLDTSLKAMGKKGSAKAKNVKIQNTEEEEVEVVAEQQEDDLTYNMGEILFAEDNVNEDNQILNQQGAAQADDNDKEEDVDENWVDDEISLDDEDPYLDNEYYDPDGDPYEDD